MRKVVKYISRLLLITIASITFLLVITALFIQTNYFKSRVPAIIEKGATSYLSATLKIEKVDGNFFKGFILTDILILDGQDSVAYIPKLSASYNLYQLLKNRLEITSITIEHPSLFLKQTKESIWNIQKILMLQKSSNTDTTSSSTDTTSSSFSIDIKQFSIKEGLVKIESAQTVFPKRVESIDLNLSLFYSEESKNLKLHKFNLETQEPNLLLKELTATITGNKKGVKLNDLEIETAYNQIYANGSYYLDPKLIGEFILTTEPISFNEFSYYMSGVKIDVNPTLELVANAKNNSLLTSIQLNSQKSGAEPNKKEKNQSIKLEIDLDNFPAIIYDKRDSLIKYKIIGKFFNLNLANWGAAPEMDYQINGSLLAKGMGANPETLVTRIEGNFKNSIIENHKVDLLDFEFDIERGDLRGNGVGRGAFGEISITPAIEGFLKKSPSYSLQLMAKDLNLELITGQESLTSNLNLKGSINGNGFDPKTLNAKANIFIGKSNIAEISIDTALASLTYSLENLLIEKFNLKTKSLTVDASGNYSPNSTSNITLTAHLQNLDEFDSYIPIEGLKTGNIFLNTKALLTEKDTVVNANLVINNIRNNSLQIDSITAVVTSSLDSASIYGTLANTEISTNFNTVINWRDQLKVRLDSWLLNYKQAQWSLKESPAYFTIDSTTYTVENFKLAPNGNDSLGYIWVNGFYSTDSNEGLDLKVANLNIQEITKLTGQEIDATGDINIDLSLKGSASSPLLTGNFSINQPVFNEYTINKFQTDIDYQENCLSLEGIIAPRDSGRIELTAQIPLQLRLDSISYKLNPEDSISGTLFIDKFPLSLFQTLNLAEEINGYIEGSASINGPLNSLNPYGSFRLTNASFKIPQYGIDYNKVLFNTSLQKEKIIIDTFQIHSLKGEVTAQGQVDFISDFYKGKVRNSTIKIAFNQFSPFNHKQFNMQLSGDASISGKKGEVLFGGDITVPKAEINLPYLFNLMGKFNSPTMPKSILMQEIERQKELSDSTTNIVPLKSINISDSATIDYLKNFTGKLNLTIPRNTWVKNNEMRIELSGDLELIKNQEFFELFGTVNVVRGQYEIFGKTFKIDQGTITFQGGEDYLFQLNLDASYIFRNSDKIEQKLAVNLHGTIDNPKVNFTLDGNSIEEGDALSYIFFGSSLNQLSISQQENISGASKTSIAGSAAASLLSSQLTKFLGDKLNVDYIEVKSNGNFSNATVTVGKYITNDIFVSYEKRFGETHQEEIDKYEVKLEYLISKFLFLQLNNSSSDSGFDLIFKIESK